MENIVKRDILWFRKFSEWTQWYKIENLVLEAQKDGIVEVAEVDIDKTFFLQVTIKQKLFAAANNPNSFVVGDRVVSEASIKFYSEERNDIFRSNESGQILLPIDTGSVYTFLAGKEGYLNKGVEYSIT